MPDPARDDPHRRGRVLRLGDQSVGLVRAARSGRFETVYWVSTKGIDSTLANEWTAQTVPLVCSAIRAAVRIAITGTEGAAERIEKLCGDKRWVEGGPVPAKELQTAAQVEAQAA